MATKKPRTNLSKQVSAKASKPSTYAAISGLAAGLGGILSVIFPMHALAINGVAAAVGVIAGSVGTFKGVPANEMPEAP